ncbi:colicin V production protein CvpA [Staphylococcus nepalensis]|uniref:Colicin V production protein CvpA n=1 Tax=Staphylococcus nepalensis TaxID=214473 RepID=A0A2T4S911_9STAP|nr:CvpA family protein [Staphylococcus nepalensis]AWI44891.1 colicin V production protein CvpA [Staphylococcus nepalensis]PTK58171.1 colicin V production protein CvpA [Staphylococcus nepalensis]
MIIDILVVLLFIYIGMIGFRRGLWLTTLHLGTTMFALWLAQRYYRHVAQRLELFVPYPKTRAYDLDFAFQFANLQQRFEHVVAFVIIATLTKAICYGVVVLFDNIVQQSWPNMISRVSGMVLSLISSSIISAILLYGIAIYPNGLIQQQLSHSIITEYILLHIPFISTFITQL